MVTEQVKTAVSFSSTRSVASALRMAFEMGSVRRREQTSLSYIPTQVTSFFLKTYNIYFLSALDRYIHYDLFRVELP